MKRDAAGSGEQPCRCVVVGSHERATMEWMDAPLACVLFNLAAVGFGYALAPVLIRQKGAESNVHDDADIVGSLPVFAVITGLAFYHTLSSGGSVETRWTSTSISSRAFLWLYLVRQLVSFPFVFIGATKFSDKVLMTVHHIVSIVAYGNGLLTNRLHWYATLDGCCEITTIFLNVLLAFRAVGYKGVLNTVNGITLWAAFLIFRLGLFPYWLWCFSVDIARHPGETSAKVTKFELLFYPATTLLLLAMSIMWFVSLTKGMLKALGMLPARKAGKTP